MPVAVNCAVVARAMLGLVGDTWIETSVADVTVKMLLPDTAPDVAVMVVEPTATVVASPRDPAVLLTVAMEGDVEPQVTDAVRSAVVLSE